eukprot:361689-Chlamydomonas_euryale.AAC.17
MAALYARGDGRGARREWRMGMRRGAVEARGRGEERSFAGVAGWLQQLQGRMRSGRRRWRWKRRQRIRAGSKERGGGGATHRAAGLLGLGLAGHRGRGRGAEGEGHLELGLAVLIPREYRATALAAGFVASGPAEARKGRRAHTCLAGDLRCIH